MTPQQQRIKLASNRVLKYLIERSKIRGTDLEAIASLHVGEPQEAILLASDLKILLETAIDAAIAQEGKP